jgi:endonuclease/exonuclease/phosphatase (EEP) superfamily protein YafD
LPEDFSVLCWNVEKGHNEDLLARLQSLADELEPDLVFLQETHLKISRIDGYGGTFAPGWSYPWPGGRAIGVAILSRAEPVSYEKLPTKDREFGVTAPKVSLAQTWDLPGEETMLIMNIHGLAFEGGKTLAGFRRQLEAIEGVVAGHDGPALLAGDFNTWSDYRLSYVLEMAGRLELVEIDTFEGPVPRTTGDQGSTASNNSFGVNPDLPLDRVFVRQLDVVEARVLDETVSDHVPLFIRCRQQLPDAEL